MEKKIATNDMMDKIMNRISTDPSGVLEKALEHFDLTGEQIKKIEEAVLSKKKNFKLVSGAELILFNIDAVKGKDEVCIVEGEMDALSFYEMGITNVVSVPNGASKGGRLEYMDNCWSYFEDVKVIYIGTDNDEPGRALRDELARRLGKERCKIIDYGKFKDANEVLQADPLLLPDMVKNATWYPIEGIFDINSLRQEVVDMKKNGLKAGENISIEAINQHITWVPGYVTGITGVPNHGKGEFLDQIIVDLAHLHGWPFGIYSPENYPLALHISKFASKVTGEAFNAMPDSALNQFMDEYNDLLYFIMPPQDLTLDSILDSAAILVKKSGIKGLVIDPWNKLDHQFTGPETQYISQCLDKVDLFARKYGVHVFLVVHPAKLHKDKETGKVEVPTPYSISGSAHWYNKLANCLTVYRNFYDDGTSTTDIHIQKVKFKHWGSQGVVSLSYNPFSGRYYTVGFENRQSYLHAPVQTALPLNIKPNVDFTVPKKDQWEDEVTFENTDEIPF